MPNAEAAARIDPRAWISSSSWMNRGPMTLSPPCTTMSTARARAPPRQRTALRHRRAPGSEIGDELEVDFIDGTRWTLRLHDPIREKPEILPGRDQVHAEGRPPIPRVRVRAVQLSRVVEPFALEHRLQPRQKRVGGQHIPSAGVLMVAAERPRSMNASPSMSRSRHMMRPS